METRCNPIIIGKELYASLIGDKRITDNNRITVCMDCIIKLMEYEDKSFKRRCLIEYISTMEGTEELQKDLSAIGMFGWICANTEIKRGRYGVDLESEEERKWDAFHDSNADFEICRGL